MMQDAHMHGDQSKLTKIKEDKSPLGKEMRRMMTGRGLLD